MAQADRAIAAASRAVLFEGAPREAVRVAADCEPDSRPAGDFAHAGTKAGAGDRIIGAGADAGAGGPWVAAAFSAGSVLFGAGRGEVGAGAGDGGVEVGKDDCGGVGGVLRKERHGRLGDGGQG